jgi:Tol biopolymer transport system component
MHFVKRMTILIFVLLFSACSLRNTPPPTALYQVNADGSNLALLLSSPDKGYWGPALSPNGKYLVFTFGAPGKLYIANADGSEQKQLTNNGRTEYLAAWSPDSQVISFLSQSGEDTKTAEIYTIRPDGSHETRLTDNDASEYGTSWSPDGSKIVFGSERGGEWQIYTMQSDGTNQLPLPTPAQGNAPAWSPDGTKIVFTSNRDGDDDIWIMNADGSNQVNLTRNTAWDDQPQWSPGGMSIAFTSDRDGTANVFVMNIDGSEAKNLTPELTDVGIPVWSPDGSYLMFHAAIATK